MASSLGISGTARMRKGELIAAIQERQGGDGRVPGPRGDARGEVPARAEAPRGEVRAEVRDGERREENGGQRGEQASRRNETGEAQPRARRASRPSGPPEVRVDDRVEAPSADAVERVSERGGESGERDFRRDGRDNRNERDGRGERESRG